MCFINLTYVQPRISPPASHLTLGVCHVAHVPPPRVTNCPPHIMPRSVTARLFDVVLHGFPSRVTRQHTSPILYDLRDKIITSHTVSSQIWNNLIWIFIIFIRVYKTYHCLRLHHINSNFSWSNHYFKIAYTIDLFRFLLT